MKKSIVLTLLIAVTVILSATALGADKLKSARLATDTTLQIFGEKIETDVVSAEISGVDGAKNYVSARDLAERLGYQVSWDAKTKVISVDLYPQFDIQIDAKDIEKHKPEAKKAIDALLSKFSTRKLDSFSKEMAYYQQLFGSDPTILSLLMVEDYKTFKNGGDSQFDYLWIDLDK